MVSASVHPIRAATPTPAELLARARAMIPSLKARAAQAEADRRVPTETIAEMQAAGFFRILQPKRWGGYEMDPQAFFDVQMALAEGCMSTGWVYGVVGGHPYELALFPDAAQHEVWDTDTSVLISSPCSVSAQARSGSAVDQRSEMRSLTSSPSPLRASCTSRTASLA